MNTEGLRIVSVAGVLALAVVWAAGGCGGLSKAYPVKDQFAMRLADPAVPAQPPPSCVLRVNLVRIAPPYDDLNFVYRTGDLGYETDYYNLWVASPSRLLTDETVRRLMTAGTAKVVLGPSDAADAGCRLDTMVTDLYGDYRNASKPVAYVRARFMLLQFDEGTISVLHEWCLEASEPMDKPGAAGLAAAWSRAYGGMLDRLSRELQTYLASRGAIPTIRTDK